MTNERQIYLLNPKEFSPETIAVAFAKTSRSPEFFREIAHGLNDEKSADFHEKWVVGYGHSSVAEHAVLHLAIENVSRLAVESIEFEPAGFLYGKIYPLSKMVSYGFSYPGGGN